MLWIRVQAAIVVISAAMTPELVRMYMDGLFQYLNSILHDPQLAEDCGR